MNGSDLSVSYLETEGNARQKVWSSKSWDSSYFRSAPERHGIARKRSKKTFPVPGCRGYDPAELHGAAKWFADVFGRKIVRPGTAHGHA